MEGMSVPPTMSSASPSAVARPSAVGSPSLSATGTAAVACAHAAFDHSSCCCGGRVHAASGFLDDCLCGCDAACRACEDLLPALAGIVWHGGAAEEYRLRLRAIAAVCDDSRSQAALLRARAQEAA